MTVKMKISKLWITVILHVFLLTFTGGQETTESVVAVEGINVTEICNQGDKDISINFENMQLHNIGSKFLTSAHVVALSLRGNDMLQIANDAFAQLPNLCYLDLSNNYLIQYILDLELPAKLKVLVLDSNVKPFNPYYGQYYEQPLKISRTYPEVEYLYLQRNRLSNFEVMWKLAFPNLKYLYLANNNFGSGSLSNIPKSVTHLYLGYNAIARLDIENMEKLVSLSLDGNKLKSNNYFDEKIVLRDAINLKILSLADNQIIEIDSTFFIGLSNLTSLNLSNNKISSIHGDSFLHTPNLQTLFLDHNELTSFPHLCVHRKLERLYLQYNKIESISPSFICEIFTLKYLNLTGNHISSIESDAFQGMNALEVLDLSDNILHQLPIDWNLSMDNLIDLYLNKNNFKDLDHLYLNSSPALQNVYLANNFITTIKTDSFCNLNNINLHLI